MRRRTTNKPMSDTDYERIEQELQRQLQHDRIGMRHEQPRPRAWSDDSMTTQSLGDYISHIFYVRCFH